MPSPSPFAPRTASTFAVTCAVSPALCDVASAAVILPAATAASIFFVASATSAVISADFFAPAIAPRVSPALRRDLIVASSIPMIETTSASRA